MRKWFDRVALGLGLAIGVATLAYSQGASLLGLQNGLANSPVISGQDQTAGVYFGTGFSGWTKHVATGNAAAAVTVASCGTGTITGSDTAGKVTATGATSCQVVFGAAYGAAPFCIATDGTTAAGLNITGVTTAHFTVGGLTSGDVFYYACIGQAGG